MTVIAQSPRGPRAVTTGIIVVIVLAVFAMLTFFALGPASPDDSPIYRDWFKVFSVAFLPSVLPLLAYSYFYFRRERRLLEVDRIVIALNIGKSKYVEMFRSVQSGPYFVLSVSWAWALTVAGLTILFFGDRIWNEESRALGFPKEGSSLVFGMAFLGSYVWGLQYVFRRYVLNDLLPGAFFRLSIRMLIASISAMIIYNAYQELVGAGEENLGIWPALAFFLGAFPQRGLNWIMARIPMLSDHADPSVRNLPLDMIEGIDAYDQMRLEEIGIDNAYDLANYDFVPLILKTSYGAREVSDWILQAKLCVRCGDAIGSLRQQGIRGIHDLAEYREEDLGPLANETAATLSSLKRAWTVARNDPDIKRLQDVSGRLTRFTKIGDPASEGGAVAADVDG